MYPFTDYPAGPAVSRRHRLAGGREEVSPTDRPHHNERATTARNGLTKSRSHLDVESVAAQAAEFVVYHLEGRDDPGHF